MVVKHAEETNSCAMAQKFGITEIYYWTLDETERIKVCQFHTESSESSNKGNTKMHNFSEMENLPKSYTVELFLFLKI
jgi:hypothetical protein